VKRRLVQAMLLGAVALALGAAVVVSGIIPIEASGGHWRITEWFLELAKRRSVATHTLGVEVDLGAPWLVLKGAGHYESGCRPCHGSPGVPPPKLARAMTPPAPGLSSRIPTWEPEELFYIVKHGIKLTGMPAWVAQERDDEVVAVVAFLLAMPELDAQGYTRMVFGETRAGSPLVDRCARCHGVDGTGRGLAAFPKLAGQRREYLLAALRAYASGQRNSGIMEPIAAGLTPDEMVLLADHYSGLPGDRVAAPDPSSAEAIQRGEAIARDGVPLQRVPSCSDCHGPSPTRRNPAYPRLAGQYADYLILQLKLFADRQRGGGDHAHLMFPVADRLSPAQRRDVALYYASLPASP
jgi:cytochrome c553